MDFGSNFLSISDSFNNNSNKKENNVKIQNQESLYISEFKSNITISGEKFDDHLINEKSLENKFFKKELSDFNFFCDLLIYSLLIIFFVIIYLSFFKTLTIFKQTKSMNIDNKLMILSNQTVKNNSCNSITQIINEYENDYLLQNDLNEKLLNNEE